MSNMVTRCPQCQTSFRVTDEHLKLANGAVRCGSCLLVFQARQHWVNPDCETAAPPAAEPSRKFSFDQSAIDSSASSAVADSSSMPSKSFDLSAAVRANPLPAASASHLSSKKAEEIGDDEKISDDFGLEEDEPVIAPSKPVVSQAAFGTPDDDYSSVFTDFDSDNTNSGALDIDLNDFEALASDESELAKPIDEAVADESWARELLDEDAHQPDKSPAEDFTNPVDVDAARRDLGIRQHRDPFAADDVDSGAAGHSAGRAQMIAHIEPLPVDLQSNRVGEFKTDWKYLLVWGSIAAALALLLVVQYTFFNFEQLARASTSRSYMKTVCHVLGCRLPIVENWRYIKIQNLVVRKHPQNDNALVIDAMLLNTTDQELPFPKLEMYFSDLTKTPVASRRFEPAEYLSGELSGQTMMPPGRPVHIALEIMNPGDKAINWSMLVAGNVE